MLGIGKEIGRKRRFKIKGERRKKFTRSKAKCRRREQEKAVTGAWSISLRLITEQLAENREGRKVAQTKNKKN